MGKDSYKLLLAIRYIIYLAVTASIFIVGGLSTVKAPKLLIYLLLYIINTQIRIYFLKNKPYFIFVSLLVEIPIIYLLYINFGGFTFVYYFIAILDAALMLPSTLSYIMIILLYISVILESMNPSYYSLQRHPIINVIFNTLIVIGFGGLGRYITEERERKAEAQKLYDQIRISEQELKKAYERLEQYSSTIEELTVLRERTRISREIHDTVGHTLSTLIIQLQALPFLIKSNSDGIEETINGMVEYSKNGLEDVRRAVRELNPASFDSQNGIFVLQELINSFQKNSGIKVKFTVSKYKYELTSDQSLTLYRIFQEAFNNSIRHGKATSIEVNMNFTENDVYVFIKDNGTGCEGINISFGLSGMKERINSIGGQISFSSESGHGFEISILIPRNKSIL